MRTIATPDFVKKIKKIKYCLKDIFIYNNHDEKFTLSFKMSNIKN
jgi:hypothetical protein